MSRRRASSPRFHCRRREVAQRPPLPGGLRCPRCGAPAEAAPAPRGDRGSDPTLWHRAGRERVAVVCAAGCPAFEVTPPSAIPETRRDCLPRGED